MKLNLLDVSTLNSQISKNKRLYSHEECDLCSKQGIKYEGILYSGPYNVFAIKNSITFKYFNKLDNTEQAWLKKYWQAKCIIYYFCSKECANMLVLQVC